MHAAAALGRWQDGERREMRARLKDAGVIAEGAQLYIEDAESSDGEGDDDPEDLEDSNGDSRMGGGVQTGGEAEQMRGPA